MITVYGHNKGLTDERKMNMVFVELFNTLKSYNTYFRLYESMKEPYYQIY